MDSSDIRKGLKLLMDGKPYVVTEFQFVKPGKGQAFTRTKLKNMLTGATIERNIRSGEKLEAADVEDRTLQYSYPDGDNFVFMNPQTGDQVFVHKDAVGDDAGLLIEPDDVEGLVNAMQQVLTRPGLAEALASRGPRRARQFDWISSAHALRDAYEDACRRRAAGRTP